MFFRRIKLLVPVLIPAIIISLSHIMTVLNLNTGLISSTLFNPGFLSERPFSILKFIEYWTLNLGVAIILIPLGFLRSKGKQRILFLCFLPLFIIANVFQLSFRIDHNHSLLNYFIIIANFYIAYYLFSVWSKNTVGKITALFLLFFLTFSGFLDLMAVKNDFRYPLSESKMKFMQWINQNTDKKSIFLSHQDTLDPVTLSGRRNYFGATYYLSVMGYDYSEREQQAKIFFEVNNQNVLRQMKNEGIGYIVMPLIEVSDFNYKMDRDFLTKNLTVSYSDTEVRVFKL